MAWATTINSTFTDKGYLLKEIYCHDGSLAWIASLTISGLTGLNFAFLDTMRNCCYATL